MNKVFTILLCSIAVQSCACIQWMYSVYLRFKGFLAFSGSPILVCKLLRHDKRTTRDKLKRNASVDSIAAHLPFP